ncbi:MAG: hypothetical protein ACJARG_001999, partial [Arcticibacterium sp.]
KETEKDYIFHELGVFKIESPNKPFILDFSKAI